MTPFNDGEPERKLVRTITIEIYEGGYLDVREGDRFCNGLTWDEVLGTVAELTHPKIGQARYRMQTAEEWRVDRIRHIADKPDFKEVNE